MSAPRSAYVALTLAAASWGLGTVIAKHAVDEIPPLLLLPMQLASSILVLSVLLRLAGIPLFDRSMPPLLGRLGLLNPGLAYALSLVGLAQITASLSVLLWAVEPLLIVGLAVLVLAERVTRIGVALSLLGAGGMVLILFEPGTTGSLTGIALTLAGVACCAVYSVVARRWLPGARETGTVVLAQQAHALLIALILAAASLLLGGAQWPDRVTGLGLVSAIASGTLYYAAAYWLYLSALRTLPASAAAASFYLIPLFGVAGGILLLGEQLKALQVVGGVVVVGAVALLLRAAKPGERAAGPEGRTGATSTP